MIYTSPKHINAAQQGAIIKAHYPEFDVVLKRDCLKATGLIKPTARSQIYEVEIGYCYKKPPDIRVLSPSLIKNFQGAEIPHVYPGNRLCLYQPKYHEFKYTDTIAQTIIPWTSLWLYYYELWHITGKWLGGGEHPERRNK